MSESYFPKIDDIKAAAENVSEVVLKTPLQKHIRLSDEYQANIFIKREDLQPVRSYKIRGAYNKILSLSKDQKNKGVVCASAGNHAQGFAYSCNKLKIKGYVYMPAVTPKQKLNKVKMFGKSYVEVVLFGDTYDDAQSKAKEYSSANDMEYIPPFNDKKVIEGQGTVGLEILDDAEVDFDYLILPVGGGGLASGVGAVFQELSQETKIVGAEPSGAPAMFESLKKGQNTELDTIDNFIDGAAVKKIGDLNFPICQQVIDEMLLVDEGKVCETILELYNQDGIIVEPAGALEVAALEQLKDKIKGKNICCVISGSNNDITRMEEIKERALLYKKLKHYFLVSFPQRSGALKEFVAEILGPTDDITHFEYTKKTSREKGAAVVGVEIQDSKDLEPLIKRMKDHGFFGEYINDKPDLMAFLV